jgi:hypothetical protein
MAVAVVVVVAVALLAYHAFHGSTAVRSLRAFAPMETLHHDRGYMNTPEGTEFRIEDARCDSGQLRATRTLHVSSGQASVQGRFEQVLVENGWSERPEPHTYDRRSGDDHHLTVVVHAPDEHGDLVIDAGADPPCEIPRP